MNPNDVSFTDVVRIVEEHFLDTGRKFIIRRAESIMFSPVGNYSSIEIQGLLDGLNDVTVVINLVGMGNDAKVRYVVSESTEVKRAEFHKPLTEAKKVNGSPSSGKISVQENQKEPEREHDKIQAFSGPIQQSQLNHLKALRIRKTHNLTDEELKKLSVDQADELIESCTKALKK